MALKSFAFENTALLESSLPLVKRDVVRILSASCNMDMHPTVSSGVEEYFTKCLDYNIVGGKMSRAQTVLNSLRVCCDKMKYDAVSNMDAAMVFGWVVEILQAFFLIEDDVMDRGETRRGKPCWYLKPGVGFANAINDGLFLEQAIYELIETNVHTKPFAREASSILRAASIRTVIGQHLDTHPPHSVEEYTRQRWLSVVRFKTAYYTFLLPCELGILVSGKNFCQREKELLKDVCLLIGEMFQAQDDMLDCFGEKQVIGKIGRDIEETKCTWLICTAMELLGHDEELQGELIRLYSIPEKLDTDVARIKEIYRFVNMEEAFAEYALELSNRIDQVIGEMQSESLKEISVWLFESIKGRNK